MKHMILICLVTLTLFQGCVQQKAPEVNETWSVPVSNATHIAKTVPRNGTWGIYALELSTGNVSLIYSSNEEIQGSALRINGEGNTFVFAKKTGGSGDGDYEIFTIGIDGKGLNRITNNSYMDIYPAWSPDGNSIAFISKREKDLDIYVMDANGSGTRKLYDSGDNDADIDWAGDRIVFTSGFRIGTIREDGTMPAQVTNPGNAGQWGSANLPIGDYDPRFSNSGSKIVFERLENPNTTHGGYDIYVINSDGSEEARLTNTGYAQGLASWSGSGGRIVYVVAAINNQGKYHLYMMKADGTDNHDITPDYFPPEFLSHAPVFSKDDSRIYFIGQWWSPN